MLVAKKFHQSFCIKVRSSFKSKLNNFFKSKLGKSTAQGEEIVGVEITNKEIRLAQISSNKANQWVLEKFFIHKVDLPEDAAVLDNADKLGAELSIAIQKAKINNTKCCNCYSSNKCNYKSGNRTFNER